MHLIFQSEYTESYLLQTNQTWNVLDYLEQDLFIAPINNVLMNARYAIFLSRTNLFPTDSPKPADYEDYKNNLYYINIRFDVKKSILPKFKGCPNSELIKSISFNLDTKDLKQGTTLRKHVQKYNQYYKKIVDIADKHYRSIEGVEDISLFIDKIHTFIKDSHKV